MSTTEIIAYRTTLSTHVALDDIPDTLIPQLTAMATFTNPEWASRTKMGRSVDGIPRRIECWSSDGHRLVLPRGLWPRIQQRLGMAAVTMEDHRVILPPVDFTWRGQLRPEQRQAAVKAIQRTDGVIIGPPGCGKTNIALAYTAARRQPTLFIVPTRELAQQTLERAHQLFDLPDSAYGLIGDGSFQIGSHLTVALPQTLVRRDRGSLGPQFGTVVVDEAHHAPASTFLEVIQSFPAKFRLGVTATPNRQDGLGPMMFAVMGDETARLTTQDLVREQRLILPQVRQIATHFVYPYTENYTALMATLIADTDRNALIIDHVIGEAQGGHHSLLVLSERVAHAETLHRLLQQRAPQVTAAVMTGSTSKTRRTALLEAMRTGALTVLFASKLADEGLDLPNLDRIFLTTGGRSESRVAQQVGRIMRPAPNKATAMVLDFVDWYAPILAAQAKARFWRVYKPLGAYVIRVGEVSA